MAKKAVVLLSGGLDSTTTLALVKQKGYKCYALSFLYGQRHGAELNAARIVADTLGVEDHQFFPLNLAQFGGSALTDQSIPVPNEPTEGIPVTYVPARNTIFLSVALGWAEVLPASDIFIGVNAIDYSGYPDCRPEFIAAFEKTANLGTRTGIEGEPFRIHTPLIDKSKAEIIRTGLAAGLDYSITVSCYSPDGLGRACGACDACRLRAAGFEEAGVADPTRYQELARTTA